MMRPRALREHVPPGRLRQVEDGVEVDAQHVVPVLRRVLRRGCAADGAGVVDEDVEPAELVDRLGDRGAELVGGRGDEVAAHRVDAPAEGADAFCGVRGIGAVEEGDVGAGLGERDGGALAEATTRARDQGDLSVEAERIEDHAAASWGAMKVVVSSPIPEIRTVTASPPASGRWDCWASASFWGVPVEMTSPGSSVMTWLR